MRLVLSTKEQRLGPFIDCHNHLAEIFHKDPQLAMNLALEAAEKQITFFMQGGIGPENWANQLSLSLALPQQIGFCFGLHPYWISEHSDEECELGLDRLTQLLNKTKLESQKDGTLLALGELGLDFRPHIVKNHPEHQIRFFEMQLEMSRWFDLPVVFHFVRCFEESKRIFDFCVEYPIRGMVHSFNGNCEQLNYWVKKDLLISISGSVCHPQNKKLHESVKNIPLELLILETDSPDQSPPDYPRGENRPMALWSVAKTIGAIRNLDADKILDISNKNFQRVFGNLNFKDNFKDI